MSANLKDQAQWEASPLAFLSRQFIQGVPRIPSTVNLSGQTALITGSNVGLGFECARQLLALNLSHLIIAVRSQARGDAAAKKLQAEFPNAKIEVSLVDMSSYRSIQDFAKRCESLPRLDIAILNAGLSRPKFERDDETKHEVTVQINYLSTALLTIVLIPVLKEKRGAGSPGRLAVVGSDMAYWAKWDHPDNVPIFDVLDNASNFSSTEAYKMSKFFLLFFVEKLSHLVSADEVIINFPNPGACRGTQFGSDGRSGIGKVLFWIASHIVAKPVSAGARSYVDAVTVKGAESHGGFVGEGKVKPLAPIMYEEAGHALQERAWNETMNELSFANPLEILKGIA
ncbi:short-chain dehydrogenase reductase family [Fusarium albosuccineum]|uniref:Short-chain dehydrogenase reductase family n=1 Tax=Fusarium albosuccineum TaxID=1237068 RepID=A0A8H4LI39_9HYPO|nr:short-chain dehydrogenase reductase family [Fusarium albosuccineum]